MFSYLLKKWLGTKNEREIKKLVPLVGRINELEPRMKALKDEDFPRQTAEWKRQIQEGKRSVDDLLPEAFALVREAVAPYLGDGAEEIVVATRADEGGPVEGADVAVDTVTGRGIDALRDRVIAVLRAA